MRAEGGSQGRRYGPRGLCLSGVLLVGFASGAFAQRADTAETKKTDNKVWTSESHRDPDRIRDQKFRYKGSGFPPRVSGVVRLASGGAPYPPVEVFICGQPAGSTDEKGRFNVPAPPAAESGFSERCRLSIQYPGTKPISVGVPRAAARRFGVLVLEPLPGFEGAVTSATTREAPKAALRAYQKGAREENKPKPNLDKAAARYEEAVALYPDFAEAWTALGRTRLGLGDLEGAMPALETAIAADERFPVPYRMLLRIRMRRNELRPAAVIATALLRLVPGDDEARYYHALATFGLQRYDEAAASAQALIDKGAGERLPQTFQILGEIYSDRGEIEAAAQNFRAYLELAPDAPSAPEIRKRLRDWGNAGAVPSDDQGAVRPTKLLSRRAGF